MKILVDADACPVISQIEEIAKEENIEVILLCDTAHVLSSNYSTVKVISKGADAVDFALISMCKKEDIVVTQDYGVAAMALGKGAKAIHQSGKWYTNENIDMLLMERHMVKEIIRKGKKRSHVTGQKKRTEEDDIRFQKSFIKLIQNL